MATQQFKRRRVIEIQHGRAKGLASASRQSEDAGVQRAKGVGDVPCVSEHEGTMCWCLSKGREVLYPVGFLSTTYHKNRHGHLTLGVYSGYYFKGSNVLSRTKSLKVSHRRCVTNQL